jgi:enterochelin esterase-like enzyme
MKHRRQLASRLAALMLAVFALAGCGGGSGNGSAKASTTTASSASSRSTTTSLTTTTSTTASLGPPTMEDGSFHSNAVDGTLHYSIALPAGYGSSNARYPVVYFLHGLPGTDQSYKGIGGYADSLAKTGHAAIVVGAQGARAGDTDPEWHNWGPGRNWETATESELVHYIDSHYRTLAKRSGRAIIGVSAGGYGATLIAIHHPGTYQVIESWSGYFVITDPDGKPLDLGSPGANADASAHAAVPDLESKFAPYGKTFFGFYIGAQDPYPGFVQDNQLFDKELDEAGIPHVFELYQGAHNGAFWQQHQDAWLGGAVERLDPPS